MHQRNIHASGFRSLAEGEPVEFQLQEDSRSGKVHTRRTASSPALLLCRTPTDGLRCSPNPSRRRLLSTSPGPRAPRSRERSEGIRRATGTTTATATTTTDRRARGPKRHSEELGVLPRCGRALRAASACVGCAGCRQARLPLGLGHLHCVLGRAVCTPNSQWSPWQRAESRAESSVLGRRRGLCVIVIN